MDKLQIRGGRRLKGVATISGAKNAALPEMAASLLATGTCVLSKVPDLKDVRTLGRLLENLGAGFKYSDCKTEIDVSRIGNFEAPYDLVRTMRASVLVLGPLVARYGRARVSLPGGCAIGARPVNLHIMGLEKMGAKIELKDGYIIAKSRRLRGARICLDTPTVTGTENILMAASLARGTTVIENAAREPEISDLAALLSNMGARISGAGQSVIEIEGVEELKPYNHTVIPDRVETGTLMVASAITGGDVLIKGAVPEHVEAVTLKLIETGASVKVSDDSIRVIGDGRPASVDLKTAPYPGFPTDMQAQFMALMCIAGGTSIIQERIFENRFMHVAELNRMGADIGVEGGVAAVRGVDMLRGAEVMATDLRASASLVIAGLAAEGKTVVNRIYHLDRGYDRLEDKLSALGADIKRVK